MSLFDRMLESSNQVPPTDHQLALARQMGLEVKPGMSLDDVSQLISQARDDSPPTPEQLELARKLGITVVDEMSTNDVRKRIEQAKSSGMFTEHQMAEAMALGVSVHDEMTYAEVDTLIRKASVQNPPLEKQLELCAKIGLPIKPGMNRGQVDRLLEFARNNPRYADKFHACDPATNEALDQKQRVLFGDRLVDQLQYWKRRIGPDQFLIIYRKQSGILVDVAQLESATLRSFDSPHVRLALALPLVVNDENGNDCLAWGKDESLPADDILSSRRLKSPLEPHDLNDYWRLVAHGKRHAEERTQS